MIRSIESLRREQDVVLTQYRESRTAPAPWANLPGAGGVSTAVTYGRVSVVVTSDATHGPHLEVVKQVWTGSPPTPSDVTDSLLRCYPAPGTVVSDYLVNDYVRVTPTHGAMIADPLP